MKMVDLDVDYLNKLHRENCEKYPSNSQEFKDFKKFYNDVIDLMKYQSEKYMEEQVEGKRKICKWLYADWCHCPKDEELEKCGFYFDNYMCEDFEEK